MKILLFGEYSGLYKNLKEGLDELGHETKIVSRGDGWKKIESDIKIVSSKVRGLSRITKILGYIKVSRHLKKYDVVQIINPYEVYLPPATKILYNFLYKSNDKIFISAVGDDYYYFKKMWEYRYNPYMNQNKDDICKKYKKKITDYILQKSQGVISGSYDYSEAYRNHYKFKGTIPFPINTNKIVYKENKVKEKIVIFHGLNREDFKGTEYIKEALSKIKDKYGDKVEIIIDGRLPLEEYLKVIERTNIIIDQCKSYGYGMNAIYSLAMGKVVLSGAEPEAIDELGIKGFCPVVNIIPNSEQIFIEIEKFILNPNLIQEYGMNGRKYVEKYHDYKKVAQKYLDIWEQSI